MSRTSTMPPTLSEPTKKALLNEGVEDFSRGGEVVTVLPLFLPFPFCSA